MFNPVKAGLRTFAEIDRNVQCSGIRRILAFYIHAEGFGRFQDDITVIFRDGHRTVDIRRRHPFGIIGQISFRHIENGRKIDQGKIRRTVGGVHASGRTNAGLAELCGVVADLEIYLVQIFPLEVILAIQFIEPDCCIGGGSRRSVVRIVEDLFSQRVENAAVFRIFGIDAEHIVAVKLVLEANGDIHRTIAGLECPYISAVARDCKFDRRLAVICIVRNYDNICSDRGPVIASFTRGNGEFDRNFSLVTKAVIFKIAEDTFGTLRYTRNVVRTRGAVRSDDFYLVRSPCRVITHAVAEAIDGRQRIGRTCLGSDSHDGDETLVALDRIRLWISYLREACTYMEQVRADRNVAGGIDAGGFEVAEAAGRIDGRFRDGKLYRIICKEFAVALADFVPRGIGTAEDAVAAVHAGAVHAHVGIFREQDRRGEVAILVHIHEMVACETDNLRGGTVNADSFRDRIMMNVLRRVAEDGMNAVFAVGHAEACHFGPSAGRFSAQRVEHPHGIASTVDNVRVGNVDKVPADGHSGGIEAVEGVHDRIADLQQAILGNISPVGVAGRATCTESVVLAGQVHVGSIVYRIGGGDSPCLAERERRCGMVHTELGVNRRVVQAEGINAAPYRSVLRVRENAVHKGVYLVISVEIRDGVVDGVGGNAIETTFHGIALALRNLVPGDGELVRSHVIKSREFSVLRERHV